MSADLPPPASLPDDTLNWYTNQCLREQRRRGFLVGSKIEGNLAKHTGSLDTDLGFA